MSAEQVARIRALNDAFRTVHDAVGVRIADNQMVVTRGVISRGDDFLLAAVRAVAEFEGFTPDNDPWQEHDFGSVVDDGQKLLWKIDYYDATLTWGAEDPSDPLTCRRVLTIMLAEEY